ncbi:DUF3037 domain-containing protein [Granulicella arctica]|uniref:DUF3037 domain-containing protein n=1 Tax=Granulicella arctica TaxID=940613 RepID=UPI0021DFBDCE|nr:DUF3037 domain-containing protein [Granulicella arctica]
MKERLPCEFFLIRYVPDVVKGEFANIGVLLREAMPSSAGPTAPLIRFTRDWSRVRCIDASADIPLLEALEAEIAERLEMVARGTNPDTKPILQVLEDTLANSLQITEARACLAESLPAELEQLMRMYVEPLKVVADKSSRLRTGRAAITGAMRTEFERAGVWALMRKRIAASMYTAAGDPMKLDCGYRPNGVIRIFHAVSLEGDVEAAKVLAFTAPQLRDGVARVEQAKLEMTAIVEPIRLLAGEPEDEASEAYRFGVETMERQAIRVMTVNDLARIAETARVELRV